MELQKKNLQFYELAADRQTTYEESTDAIVPDAYPDIERISCAFGQVTVKDISPQNDRILVSGTVDVTLLYQPEREEGLRRMDTSISFAHIEESKALTAESTCFVRVQILQVEAREVNSRKVNVIARICFETAAYTARDLTLTEDITDEALPLQILRENHTLRMPKQALYREFTVLEDVETPGVDGCSLVQSECALSVEEARTMHGKAIIKGIARLHCILLRPDGQLSPMEQALPFTQIIDFDDLEEGQPLDIRFSVQHLDIELHDAGVLSIGINAGALLCVMQEEAVCPITDLYQTTHPVTMHTRPIRLTGIQSYGELQSENTENISLGAHCSQVLDARAVCQNIQQENPEHLRLTIHLRLLFLNHDDKLYCVCRTLGISVALPQSIANASLYDVLVQPTASPAGADSAAVRFTIRGKLFGKQEQSINDITELAVNEAECFERSAVTLILRYVHATECLWDIAKSYHTTVNAIRNANEMANDTENVREQLLLIPICEK